MSFCWLRLIWWTMRTGSRAFAVEPNAPSVAIILQQSP
jgi:hypothetical protein